jgi:hypothetical protein
MEAAMVIQDVTTLQVKVAEDEVVVCPLPPMFVDGLADACEGLAWEWIAEHAPKSVSTLLWYAAECAQYTREAETHGVRVSADIARDMIRDLPEILRALEAGGGDLHMAGLLRGGVA